jgi:hypothetical protein
VKVPMSTHRGQVHSMCLRLSHHTHRTSSGKQAYNPSSCAQHLFGCSWHPHKSAIVLPSIV